MSRFMQNKAVVAMRACGARLVETGQKLPLASLALLGVGATVGACIGLIPACLIGGFSTLPASMIASKQRRHEAAIGFSALGIGLIITGMFFGGKAFVEHSKAQGARKEALYVALSSGTSQVCRTSPRDYLTGWGRPEPETVTAFVGNKDRMLAFVFKPGASPTVCDYQGPKKWEKRTTPLTTEEAAALKRLLLQKSPSP